MIRRPPRSTLSSSSAASDVYKRLVMSKTMKTSSRSYLVLSVFLASMMGCITPGTTSSGPLEKQSFENMPRPNQPASLTVSDASSKPIYRASPAAHQQRLPAGVATQQGPATLPPQAYTGPNAGIPYPAPWTPPGILGPFPEDEYVYQGGDAYQLTNVAQDFSIDNLDEEDTIAHYHTSVSYTHLTLPTKRIV